MFNVNLLTFLLPLSFTPFSLSFNYTEINLPDEHLQYYFSRYPKINEECDRDPNCPYKEFLATNKCWGYEYNCKRTNRYSEPICLGDHKGWVKTKGDQIDTFYTQADFGYIKAQLEELKVYCEPLFADDSSLECSDNLRFCRGRNIMINFTSLAARNDPIRYKMDVLGDGDIGGYCNFYKEKLKKQLDHMSPLQSWAPEIKNFKQLQQKPIQNNDCDVIIEKPTFIMKIDATVNMYHHFCDFLNLYASIHLNSTRFDDFTTNTNILIWETFSYRSAFESTFEAFTTNQIWDLKTFRGDTVCFKNIVFPLLPRMIFGLYYNTPIIYGCERSGLFHAFSKFILHRLNVPLYKRKNDKVRITFLSRDTTYRKINNENELIKALENIEEYEVRKVVYNRNIEFKKQLEISRNSDVFIGIHGAGLTHLMFLPDWAAIFEIYNCEDPNCYKDLARLRGVKYFTWENQDKLIQQDEGKHPEGGAHAKFTNYSFDKTEFLRLVKKAADHVKSHRKFNEFIEKSSKKSQKGDKTTVDVFDKNEETQIRDQEDEQTDDKKDIHDEL
nr:EGF domain-specific O-linked N-acetylglucosamine transferase isoform X1 [Onthophagus taurus]